MVKKAPKPTPRRNSMKSSFRLSADQEEVLKNRASKRTRNIFDEIADGDYISLTRFLTEQGAAVLNDKNEHGNTPLMAAIADTRNDMANLLLQAGAAVDAVNNDGETPLILATMAYDDSVVAALLKAGADPGKKNNIGYTALMMAAAQGNKGAVAQLLGAGADIHQKSALGYTAAMIAEQCEQKDVLALLKKQSKPAPLRPPPVTAPHEEQEPSLSLSEARQQKLKSLQPPKRSFRK